MENHRRRSAAPGIDLVLVDFDDTIVDTAPRFERARRQLFDRLARAEFDRAEAERIHHHEVDPRLRSEYGLGPSRMPLAFAETYRALCRGVGCDVDPEILADCQSLAADIVGTPPVIPGALPALRRLAAAVPAAIYTQAGDSDYQLGCVREAGAAELVGDGRVRIVPIKTADALRETLDHFGVRDPGRVWMVGNSIRSDINPALEVGVRPLLVEVDEPWQYDVVDPLSNGFPVVGTFSEAVAFLLGDPSGESGAVQPLVAADDAPADGALADGAPNASLDPANQLPGEDTTG